MDNHQIDNLDKRDKISCAADFYINNKEYRNNMVKFKCVSHSQKNILFEMENNTDGGSWFSYTWADYYILYIDEAKRIYIINIKDVKNYINDPKNLIAKQVKGHDSGWSYMIPISVLFQQGFMRVIGYQRNLDTIQEKFNIQA